MENLAKNDDRLSIENLVAFVKEYQTTAQAIFDDDETMLNRNNNRNYYLNPNNPPINEGTEETSDIIWGGDYEDNVALLLSVHDDSFNLDGLDKLNASIMIYYTDYAENDDAVDDLLYDVDIIRNGNLLDAHKVASKIKSVVTDYLNK